MDISTLNFYFLLILFQSISSIYSYDFQCLICDNTLDGPGCGDYTREIPVRTCRTFCYFAIVYNQTHFINNHRLTRAIRDCSPYDDISIETSVLLQSKLNLTSTIKILKLKRCTSEQCNNDFYLRSNEFLFGKCSFNRSTYFEIILSFLISFYYSIK